MTSTPEPRRARGTRRLVTAAVTVGVAAATIVATSGGTAQAAELPNAQSVGRFLDGAAGGQPLENLADVKDARAKAPGQTSVQNPFDIKLFNQLDIPLTNAIGIPTQPAADAGVVNQVATANTNGKSLGASGAVGDDGGVSLGDDNDGAPAIAKINLSGSALGDQISIPALPTIPGLPAGAPISADSLGGITGTVQAVYGRAATKQGGDVVTPSSGVAGLDLSLGSPALGALLSQLKKAFGTTLGSVITGLPLGIKLPAGCALTDPDVDPIELAGENGGVTIDPDTASIKISLGKLLKSALGLDISNLDTSNFDLIGFLVKKLPSILAKGVGGIVTSLTTALANQFKACLGLFGQLGDLLDTVTNALLAGQKTIKDAIDGLAEQFEGAGAGGLGALADGLENLLGIGLNVQSGPGSEPANKAYPFESNLAATPNQATDVVKNQTLVRAIEIHVLNAKGIPSVPALPFTNSVRTTKLTGNGAAQAVRPLAAAPGDGVLNLALGNAAAGPSATAPTPTPTTTTPTPVPTTKIPTGVPAGQAAGDGGTPLLPLVAFLAVLGVLAGGIAQYRTRGKYRL